MGLSAPLSTTNVNQSNAVAPPAVPIQNQTAVTSYSTAPIASVVDPFLASSTTIGSLQYPSDRPKYYISMKISDYSRQNLISIGNLNATNYIVLPLPSQLTDSNQVSWYEKDFTTAFGNIAQAAASATSLNRATLTAQSVGQYASSVGSAIVAANAGPAGEAVQVLKGYSPNEFLTVLMKGPAYKRFSLTWKCSPRNENESESLRQIIQLINNKKSPNITAGGALFTFPSIFELGFYPNAGQLYKFKPAVIEAFTTNLAGSGTPLFYRGTSAPDSIEFSINFLELEFWLSGQYNGTNDPYDRSAINTADLLAAYLASQNGTAGGTTNNTPNNVDQYPSTG